MLGLSDFVFPLFMFGVFGIPGWLLVAVAAWKYNTYRRMTQLETNAPDETLSGPVELSGDARPVDGAATVTSPVTETDCVLYECEIEVYQDGVEPDSGGWNRLDTITARPTFLLENVAGSVAVDPTDFPTDLSKDYRTVFEGRGEAPPEALAYVDSRDDIDLEAGRSTPVGDITNESRLKLIERRLDPGDETYVLGHAVRESAPEGDTTTLIRRPDVSTLRSWLGLPVLLSDAGEQTARSEQYNTAVTVGTIGVGWLAFSVVFLLIPVANSL